MLLIILICMIVYFILALMFVSYVRNKTEITLYRWLAVAFVILLPTWDVVLGYLVYLPSCLFIPKVAIYETAETDGIYYEGEREYITKYKRNRPDQTDNELTKIGAVPEYVTFGLGFQFVESKVLEVHYFERNQKNRINAAVYRCTPLPKDGRSECTKVDAQKSKYMVKLKTIKIVTTEINFKKVIDRSTGKLLAEYNRVYYPYIPIPFFNWFQDIEISLGRLECPNFSNDYEYEDFEYRVLKPLRQ